MKLKSTENSFFRFSLCNEYLVRVKIVTCVFLGPKAKGIPAF